MKTYKIAVQSGLEDVKKLLADKGHTIVPYEEVGHQAEIAIVTGISSEYEEIETAQCMIKDTQGDEMLLINASGLTPEQVLHYVETNKCK